MENAKGLSFVSVIRYKIITMKKWYLCIIFRKNSRLYYSSLVGRRIQQRLTTILRSLPDRPKTPKEPKAPEQGLEEQIRQSEHVVFVARIGRLARAGCRNNVSRDSGKNSIKH